MLPFSYAWSNGETTATATSLNAATHTVNVTDANGCMTSCDIVIAQNSGLSCTLSVTDSILCNGDVGTIMVAPEGGDGNYEFSLDGGVFQSVSPIYGGLPGGSYTVTTRDGNGCTSTCLETITEPAPLTCSTSTTIVSDCGINDGTITVTATGGTAGYIFNAGAGTVTANVISGLSPGSYIVTVTDANDCTSTVSYTHLTLPTKA